MSKKFPFRKYLSQVVGFITWLTSRTLAMDSNFCFGEEKAHWTPQLSTIKPLQKKRECKCNQAHQSNFKRYKTHKTDNAKKHSIAHEKRLYYTSFQLFIFWFFLWSFTIQRCDPQSQRENSVLLFCYYFLKIHFSFTQIISPNPRIWFVSVEVRL